MLRVQLRGFSRKRNDLAYRLFKLKIMYNYSAGQLLFLDETAKDGASLRRSFGYAVCGTSPIACNGMFPRGDRYSSLCAFDVDGFVDWEHTTGTFDRERFLNAVRRVVLPHITPYPGPRSAPARVARVDLPHRAWLAICSGLHAVAHWGMRSAFRPSKRLVQH